MIMEEYEGDKVDSKRYEQHEKKDKEPDILVINLISEWLSDHE